MNKELGELGGESEIMVFFFIWILELVIFLVLNIQVTSKRIDTCGRRMI